MKAAPRNASKLATIEDGLTVADIVLPAGVTFADKEIDMDLTIANVYDPAAEAAEREAQAEADKAADEAKAAEEAAAAEAPAEEEKAE